MSKRRYLYTYTSILYLSCIAASLKVICWLRKYLSCDAKSFKFTFRYLTMRNSVAI